MPMIVRAHSLRVRVVGLQGWRERLRERAWGRTATQFKKYGIARDLLFPWLLVSLRPMAPTHSVTHRRRGAAWRRGRTAADAGRGDVVAYLRRALAYARRSGPGP